MERASASPVAAGALRMAAKKKTGRPARTETPSPRAVSVRLSADELGILESAAERLRRDTGRVHTLTSVLRDGALAYAREVLGKAVK